MKIYNLEHNLDFENVNNKLALGLSELDLELSINFKRNIFCTPSGITMFSSLYHYKKELLTFKYENVGFIRYLLRSNFFYNLDIDIKEDFQRHDATVNMLECTKIEKDGDPDLIDSKLHDILKSHITGKENLILGILLTTYEIVDNILEHSMCNDFVVGDRKIEQPGFVSAQYYPKNNEIEIGISDLGKGIVDTMASEAEYLVLTRKEILLKAFELNATRHKKTMPSRGNGLAKLKSFVLASNGIVRCRTNEFTIVFSNEFPDGIVEEAKAIPGTHFEIRIGCEANIDTKPIFRTDSDDYESYAILDDFFN